MSRRGRGLAFLALSILCAAVAAGFAASYGRGVERQLGGLVPVVVAGRDLRAGQAIGPRRARRLLAVRRVPARFAPPGVLAAPEEAIGRAPAAPLPAGAYLLAAQLEVPGSKREAGPRLPAGRRPVEVAVAAGGALAAAGPGTLVDVVVTGQPRGERPGRTYVAVERVELLDLRPAGVDGGGGEDGEAGDSPALPGSWLATLALTRSQALRLIGAENFARQLRLLPSR